MNSGFNDDVKNALERLFSLSGVVSYQRMNAGSLNRVWKITCDHKIWIFKEAYVCADKSWRDGATSTLKLLGRELDSIPRFVESREGGFFPILKDRQYQLQEYMQGSEPLLANEGTLSSVAAFLKAMQGVDACVPKSPRNDLEAWFEDVESRYESLHRLLQGILTLDELRLIQSVSVRAATELLEGKYLSGQHVISHGELQGSNMLFNQDASLTAVLDWDSLQMRPRIYDIAISGFFLARQKRGGFEINPNIFTKYVSSFDKISDYEHLIGSILRLYVLPTPHLLEAMLKYSPHVMEWYPTWFMSALKGINELELNLKGKYC